MTIEKINTTIHFEASDKGIEPSQKLLQAIADLSAVLTVDGRLLGYRTIDKPGAQDPARVAERHRHPRRRRTGDRHLRRPNGNVLLTTDQRGRRLPLHVRQGIQGILTPPDGDGDVRALERGLKRDRETLERLLAKGAATDSAASASVAEAPSGRRMPVGGWSTRS